MRHGLKFLGTATLLIIFGASSFGQRIGIIGDWGAVSPHRPLIAKSMREIHAEAPFAAIVTLGDNFYPSGVPVAQFVKDLPAVKIYPTFGNHDISSIAKQFSTFGVDQTYYNKRIGTTEFFILNSENFTKGQKNWLEGALSKSTATWKIVTIHRPLYTSGMHGGSRSLRASIEPLLKKYRVDLVLAGHDHDYERLKIGNITHFVSGGGGAYLRSFLAVKPGSQFRKVTPNFLVIEASEKSLIVQAFDEKKIIFDSLELKK